MTDMAIKTLAWPKFNGQQNMFLAGNKLWKCSTQRHISVHMLIIVLIMRLSICQTILA